MVSYSPNYAINSQSAAILHSEDGIISNALPNRLVWSCFDDQTRYFWSDLYTI